MIRTKIYLLIGIIAVFFSCNKIDNYERPNGAIYGKLTDLIINEGLQSEQPNGFSVRLFEKGGKMNLPILFYGKPDGTYENAMVFKNEFKVIPCEGAFFPLDTITVKVGSRTECNFGVMPFLAVTSVTVIPSAGKITASYKIARKQLGDKITERKTLVSKTPTVNNVVYNFKKDTDISAIPDIDILTSQFIDDVTGLKSGDYYVRVAVRTNNALKKYNYSKVFKVTVP